MKLLRQVRLRSVEGTTTAVFEIDLCEVGAEQFVVNYRHGRRGGKLTDGTKTVLPVARAEAERTFDKLVQEKKRKGYVDADAGLGAASSEPPPRRERIEVASADLDGRAATLLRYLEHPNTAPASFPPHRVAWRVGESRLRAAAPRLRAMLRDAARNEKVPMHTIAWALARVGDPESVPALQAAERDASLPETVRRVATVGLLDHLEGEAREQFVRQQIDRLPASVARALEVGPDALRSALVAHLETPNEHRHGAIWILYLVDRPIARQIVLERLQTLPLVSPGFRVIRHIFKAAEMRGDGEVFGILAARFETTRANPGRWWGTARPSPDYAYGPGTRKFLRRRTWRTMRRLGELDSDEFVDLAMGVLLAFTDEDGPSLLRCWCFASLLFRHDPRFSVDHRALAYRERNAAAFVGRGEAFPTLWDRHPDALLALLRRSRCAPVHHFAAAALHSNRSAWTSIATAILIELLGSRYEDTVRLAADIAIDRYVAARPDLDLVLALATCRLPAARKTAHTWISANPRPFLDDPGFCVALALSSESDTRVFARVLLGSALLAPAIAQQLVARLIAELVSVPRDDAFVLEVGRDLESLLQTTFSAQARTIGLAVIEDLLAHPQEGVQHLGASLLLAHDIRPAQLPDRLLATVMLSAHASVRTLGVRLFGELPDATLLERREVLVDLCSNPHVEVRQAVRPIVGRLARSNGEFARAVLVGLVDVLAQPETQEGLHADIVSLVRGELQHVLTAIELPLVWKLLQAPSPVAQELGGGLLERNVQPDALEVWRIAKLASHDIRAVRQAAWRMVREGIPRLRKDMQSALLILDAKWDDSREFAFTFFEQHFEAVDFTPELLVSICDSVRPDVQQFGRRLITRFFAEPDGQRYLLQLSQHPTTDMQLFATNYLERFATGHPDRIEGLQWYFRAVLVAVNRGRTAKRRVLLFLRREAQASEAVARRVAELLAELSLAIAVEYRAASIEILNDIRIRWPDVPVPLEVRLPARRSRRAV